MGFSFNPLFWFVCGSCKEAFPNTDELKEHKLKLHLSDCLQIKYIVFEEKFVDDSWTPLSLHSSVQASTTEQLLPQQVNTTQNENRVQKFQNPYVALEKLSQTANKSSTRTRKIKAAQSSSPHLPDESRASKRKRIKLPENENKETCQNESSQIDESVLTPDIVIKEEAEEFDETVPLAQEVEIDFDRGSELESDGDSESLVEAGVSNPLTPSPTPTFSEPEPEVVYDAKSKKEPQSESDLKSEPEEEEDSEPGDDSQSEYEDEFVSGSDPEGEFDSAKKDRTSKELHKHEKQRSTPGNKNPNPCENSSLQPEIDLDFNLDLPLLLWLALQEETNPSNIILLDPDPKSSKEFQPVTEANPVKCKWCQECFASEPDLRRHVSKCFLFNKDKHRFCLDCDQVLCSPHELKSHRSKPHSNKPLLITSFKCSACSQEFRQEYLLRLHEADHKKKRKKSLKTSTPVIISPIKGNSQSEYEPKSVSGSESESESEGESEGEGESNSDIIENAKKVLEIKPSTTKVKVAAKKQIQDLRAKRRAVAESMREPTKIRNSSSLPFPCTICPASFKVKWQLIKHKLLHPMSIPYKCTYPECAYGFPTSTELDKHLLKQHGHGHDTSCEDSSLEPETYLDLNLELPLLQWLALQEEKNPSNIILLETNSNSSKKFQPISQAHPVKCKWCQESFASELDLRWHVSKCFLFNKNKHRFCFDCNKVFCSSFQFKRHQRIPHPTQTETETTPPASFKCSTCCEEFRQEFILKLHEATHEQIEVSRVDFQDQDPSEVQGQGGQDQDRDRDDLIEDLSLETPLPEWLRLQTERNPSNVILLNPDPTAVPDFDVLPISDTNPVQCLLCEKSLTSEPLLRSHVISCFLHNKKNHHFCIICQKRVKYLRVHNQTVHLIKHQKKLLNYYECIECSKRFTSCKLLLTHEAGHRKDRLESPSKPICSDKSTIARLKNHTVVNMKTRPFKCSYKQCLVSFEAKNGIRKHMMIHENEPDIDHEKDFNLVSDFNLDLPLLQWLLLEEEKNPTNRILLDPDPKLSLSNEFQPVSEVHPVMCKWCQEMFLSELDLRWHVSKCFLFNKEKHRYCQDCDRSFSKPCFLRQHTQNIHPNNPRPIFKCSVCSKEFLSKNFFDFHMKTHELAKDDDDDNVGDSQSQGQGQGQGQSHGEDEKSQEKKLTYYQCRFCQKFLMNAWYLKTHERIHTGERPFKCDVGNCDKSFATKSLLNMHRQSQHMEELGLPGHLCPVCGKKFGDKSSLRDHTRSHQLKARRFKCTFDDTCSLAFTENSRLKAHIRAKHTGERPFECSQCGKSFPIKSSLRFHIKQAHEGYRVPRANCLQCPRDFWSKFELKQHMKLHEEGKGSLCDICGFLSGDVGHLTKHRRTHGNDGAGAGEIKSFDDDSESEGDDEGDISDTGA